MDKNNEIIEGIIAYIMQHKTMLLMLCVIVVFKNKIVDWAMDYICPITESIPSNNIWVLLCVLVAISIVYLTQYQWLKSERECFVSRNWTLFFLFCAYLMFRLDNRLQFMGVGDSVLSYTDYGWILVGVIEFFLVRERMLANCDAKQIVITSTPFLSDTPVADNQMDRKRYAVQLVDKILASQKESNTQSDSQAFSILINEHYGAGKTSFFMQVQELAEDRGIDVCWFKPWLYEDHSTLMVNFFRVIKEKLGAGDRPLLKMLDHYVQILSSINGYKLFSALRIEELSIETQFANIKVKLQKKGRPIIVLIDDVDRLEGDEMLNMLQMIRNMADFPNLYYIIAGDKSAMTNRLLEKKISEPEEFLKKFFNLEICFPADDNSMLKIFKNGLGTLLSHYHIESRETWDYIHLLQNRNHIFSNIRDWKRFLNALDYALANLQASKDDMLKEVAILDLVGVCLIQCVDTGIYHMLRDTNEYILKYNPSLERYFIKKGIEQALEYNSQRRTAATDYATDDISVVHTGTLSMDHPILLANEVISRSKLQRIDVIGDILKQLFPNSWNAHSQIGICFRTEYHKYFAATYRESEVSNAEIIGIMEASQEEFPSAVRKIINSPRVTAFIHKIDWYVTTQIYSRKEVLKRVLWVMDNHFNSIATSRDKKEKNIFFGQNYERAALNIFLKRATETEEQCAKEWKSIYYWLVTTSDYDNRIRILTMLSDNTKEGGEYIYNGVSALYDCAQSSVGYYIYKVWQKDKYSPEVYSRIADYRQIMKNLRNEGYVSEQVLNLLNKTRYIKYFFYHLLEYSKNTLKWNTDFIDCVIGAEHAFAFEDSQWFSLVPKEWENDFRNRKMKGRIAADDIKTSSYLRAALHFWQKQEQNKIKIKERGDNG